MQKSENTAAELISRSKLKAFNRFHFKENSTELDIDSIRENNDIKTIAEE